MTQQTSASGTGLVERPTATGPPAPVRRRTRYFWPLLAVIVVAVALLGTWTVFQTRGVEQLVDESPGVFSDHDSGIAQVLRERAADSAEHDSGIEQALRQRQAQQLSTPSDHDSGFPDAQGGDPTAAGCVYLHVGC